jgi:Tol biopolymer transport system component
MKRLFRSTLFVTTAILVTLMTVFSGSPTRAQEPTAIIDAVFAEISEIVGRPILRTGDVTYSWEEIVFPDGSLGCPAPNMNYTQLVTRGLKIDVTLTDTGEKFDFRSLPDGSGLFQCGPNGPVVSGAPSNGAPAAPVTYSDPLAYIGRDGNVYVTGDGVTSSRLTSDSRGGAIREFPFSRTSRNYRSLRWSPDGQALLFTDVSSNTIYVVQSGGVPRIVAQDTGIGFAGAWDLNGQILFVRVNPAALTAQGQVMDIFRVPVTGGNPERVASFNFTVGCGGANFDPANFLYDRETFYGFGEYALIATPNGYVVTTGCGSIGVALITPTGEVWRNENIRRPAVSPNGATLVAVTYVPGVLEGQIVNVSFANGSTTAVSGTPNNVEQITWSPDSTRIYYTTIAEKRTIQVAGNPGNLLPVSDVGFTDYDLTLGFIPAAGGTPTTLNTATGRAFGRITVSPDGNSIAYSLVPSSYLMGEQMTAGRTVDEILAAAPQTRISAVTLNNQPLRIVNPIDGGNPSFGRGNFTVTPAVDVPLPTSTIQVGGKAVVAVTDGDPLRLRSEPGLGGTIIATMVNGTIVTVLGGPQEADGLRFWQIQVDATGQIGWAVDSVVEDGEVIVTLVGQ